MAEIFAPFDVNGPFPLDKRQVFKTYAEMKAFDTKHLPDTYFAVCIEDGKMYIYDKKNEENPETGKWRANTSTDVTIAYDWDPNGNVSAIGSTPDTLSAIAQKEYSGDNIWITVDNNTNKISLSDEAQSCWHTVSAFISAWQDIPAPPSSTDDKYYGYKDNAWTELPFENYKLSDTIISAKNEEGDIELRSVVNMSLDDGLINFNNGIIINN